MKKVSLVGHFCLLCLAGSQKITQAAHSLSQLGELHVEGGLCVNPSGQVAKLARAPFLHVNRP